jgi:hypothetical protein
MQVTSLTENCWYGKGLTGYIQTRIRIIFTEQVGSSSGSSGLYSRGDQFQTRPGH